MICSMIPCRYFVQRCNIFFVSDLLMSDPSSGLVLRNLQHAQADMKKARQALTQVRKGSLRPEPVMALGWQSLLSAHKALAAVPLASATDDVMSRQIAVGRYATALLVRLRRLSRYGPGGLDETDAEDFEGDEA